MSNPQRMPRSELAVFARVAANGIADGKVKGFLPEQNDAFSTALLTEADGLDQDEKDIARLQSELSSMIARAQERRLRILKTITESKYAMRSVGTPNSEYEAIGYEPPADPRSRVKPKTPSKLTATGFSNGTNKLKWAGNNVPGRVLYVIQANRGDGKGWFMLGSTRKQSFAQTGTAPGEPFKYRVRAEGTRGQVSQWSNIGAVFGVKSK